VPDVVTSDGAEWWAPRDAAEVVRRGRDGAPRPIRVADPGRGVLTTAASPDGRLAVVVGRPDSPGWGEPRTEALSLVLVGGDGTVTRIDLPERPVGFWTPHVSLAAGPGATFWVADTTAYWPYGQPMPSLMRVTTGAAASAHTTTETTR
jgi:hypothetical protein